ncbi:hypothetical protein D3C75_1373810 [compost metagenome]
MEPFCTGTLPGAFVSSFNSLPSCYLAADKDSSVQHKKTVSISRSIYLEEESPLPFLHSAGVPSDQSE